MIDLALCSFYVLAGMGASLEAFEILDWLKERRHGL